RAPPRPRRRSPVYWARARPKRTRSRRAGSRAAAGVPVHCEAWVQRLAVWGIARKRRLAGLDCSRLPRRQQNETLARGGRLMIRLVRRARVAWSVCCLGVAVAVFDASVVQAEPSGSERETARALVGEGDRFFAAKDYTNALARYSSAYRLVRAPTVGIEVA